MALAPLTVKEILKIDHDDVLLHNYRLLKEATRVARDARAAAQSTDPLTRHQALKAAAGAALAHTSRPDPTGQAAIMAVYGRVAKLAETAPPAGEMSGSPSTGHFRTAAVPGEGHAEPLTGEGHWTRGGIPSQSWTPTEGQRRSQRLQARARELVQQGKARSLAHGVDMAGREERGKL
jgi:hypothetical protein